MSADDHVIELELQAPPPRSVHSRRGRLWGVGCVQLFLVPFTVIGLALVVIQIWCLIVFFFGISAPGTIDQASVHNGRKSVSYRADFRYRVGGVEVKRDVAISREDFHHARKGQEVLVKYLPAGPKLGVLLFVPGGSRFGNALDQLPVAIFWNAFIAVFYLAIYWTLLKERSLVKNGTPVRGRIIDKKIRRSKNTTYTLFYEFSPPQGSVPVRSAMNVEKSAYDSLAVDDAATVLVDPLKPKRNILYAPARFGAAPPAGMLGVGPS